MSWEATTWARQCGASGQLSPGEVLLLILLADHADEQWSCFPSQERLALDSNQGERTVRRQLGRLRELGLISTESRYGQGRGRIGMRYFLLREGLSALPQRGDLNRDNTRPANLAGESENRENKRPASLAGESENRENKRPANLAGERLTGQMRPTHRPNATSDTNKDRARTNPQENHQSVSPSVDARESFEQVESTDAVEAEVPVGSMDGSTDGPTTSGEVRYRGVDLRALRARVPASSDLPEAQVRQIVDVILARAVGTVQSPTAYVARGLATEYDELVGLTRPRLLLAAVSVAGAEQARPGVRELRTGEPCQDPEVHVPNYGDSVLRDCPHCRLERRMAPRAEAGSRG